MDDNVDAADSLAALFANLGHEVKTLYGGAQALAIYDAFAPDVVLLDIGMPGMDGLEAARRLRQRNRTPQTLLVAITGWGQAQDFIASQQAGFDLHLVKPLDESDVIRCLETSRKWSQ